MKWKFQTRLIWLTTPIMPLTWLPASGRPNGGTNYSMAIDMSTNPPKFSMGSGGLITEGPKITETIPMLRVMTGSTYNIDMDEKAIMSFVRVTGKDGLCYYPVENRPWAAFDDLRRLSGNLTAIFLPRGDSY